jgi:hypothetical protein
MGNMLHRGLRNRGPHTPATRMFPLLTITRRRSLPAEQGRLCPKVCPNSVTSPSR